MHPFTTHAIARQHQQDLLTQAEQRRRLRLARTVHHLCENAAPRPRAAVRQRPELGVATAYSYC